MKNRPLIIISGATAVGKTELSIRLAQLINGEIISADSMQVYKNFNIGTAKASAMEMKGVKHYLIDELDADEEFNVYEFKIRAEKYINKILSDGKIPIIVGGTGFYIQSVLYGIDFSEEESDTEYRQQLESIAKEKGNAFLHDMLQQVDPKAAEKIHENDIKRVTRALDYYHENGHPISEHNYIQQQKEAIYNYAYFVLNRDRQTIYDRINRRVDVMISDGLIDEVKGLIAGGISPDALAMQGLGYKETVRYINGEITLEELSELIKLGTRHFAKRQITWFKREKDTEWLNYEDYADTDEMLHKMIEILKEKKIV